MGLDTRAYRKATPEWKEQWVQKHVASGERPALFGLAIEHMDPENPWTVEDAPDFHQEGSPPLAELDWPGGLIGGMISSNGSGPSFRGKAYDVYVEAVTGQSLYAAVDEEWEGDFLAAITLMLEDAADREPPPCPSPYGGDDDWTPDPEARKALARWFRVCVDNDLVVSGDC